ncbi:MAG: hypothetical protein ISF22_03990 [Methanomassiliicoccus sp.]|nr:hypothetical protein [Methanomassiliicoccus sp.]
MRGAGVIAAVVIMVVILIGAGFYALVIADDAGGSVGFQSNELVEPLTPMAKLPNTTIPGELTQAPIAAGNMNLYWNITEDIYAGYGGALQLKIENRNPGSMFVYSFGLRWVDGETYQRNCSVTIASGQSGSLGLLIFGAPEAGNRQYQIIVGAAVSNAGETLWYDSGSMPSTPNSVRVQALTSSYGANTSYNHREYYNRVNERIDQKAVDTVVEDIQKRFPGGYNLLQVAEAFEWTKNNIAYQAEASGDYWQSTGETMGMRSGDCEDHALVISSIIDGLGGSARVNIIREHAFPTVFIGTTESDLLKAERSIASYYGMEVSEYRMSYLIDEHGYWMVIDTTGFPYAGGLPAKSEPTTADGGWTVLSEYLVCIDVTGKTSTSLLGMF